MRRPDPTRSPRRGPGAIRRAMIGAATWGAVLAAGAATPGPKQVAFRPGQPWPDTNGIPINAHGCGVLAHEGKYYWYGSHKMPGRTEAEKNEAGVHCYVSADLLNWEDAGLVLSVFAEGAHRDLAEAFILDRPKVIHHAPTRRFILYFKLYPPKSEGGQTGIDFGYVGVAVGDRPTGPFSYRGRFLAADSRHGSGDFAIFQDPDGAVYHICVRKPDRTLVCGQMAGDGLRPAGSYVPMVGIEAATEAPALFRREGRYYLLGSGSTGWNPNAARMFVADAITGPYRALGNCCWGVNPHNQVGPERTFGGQSTFVLEVPGKREAWIAMFDVWRPQDPVNSGYLWLPLVFEGDRPAVRWQTEWDLRWFDLR